MVGIDFEDGLGERERLPCWRLSANDSRTAMYRRAHRKHARLNACIAVAMVRDGSNPQARSAVLCFNPVDASSPNAERVASVGVCDRTLVWALETGSGRFEPLQTTLECTRRLPSRGPSARAQHPDTLPGECTSRFVRRMIGQWIHVAWRIDHAKRQKAGRCEGEARLWGFL